MTYTGQCSDLKRGYTICEVVNRSGSLTSINHAGWQCHKGKSGKLEEEIFNYFRLMLKSEEYLQKEMMVKKHLILKTSNERNG